MGRSPSHCTILYWRHPDRFCRQCFGCECQQLAIARRRIHYTRIRNRTAGFVSACVLPCLRSTTRSRFCLCFRKRLCQCDWCDSQSCRHSHTKGLGYPMGLLVSRRCETSDARIPVIFCFLSCIVNGAFMWYTKRIMPAQYRVTSRKEQSAKTGEKQSIRLLMGSLWLLPWCFWILPMSQSLQSGVVGGMQSSFNDIIRM